MDFRIVSNPPEEEEKFCRCADVIMSFRSKINNNKKLRRGAFFIRQNWRKWPFYLKRLVNTWNQSADVGATATAYPPRSR